MVGGPADQAPRVVTWSGVVGRELRWRRAIQLKAVHELWLISRGAVIGKSVPRVRARAVVVFITGLLRGGIQF